MSEEEKVQESKETYTAEVPVYYDRYLEERDRRISAELRELRSLIGVNAQRIDELRADMVRLLAEAKEDRQRIRDEMIRGFEEARAERTGGFEEARAERLRGFEEAREDRQRIREEMVRGFEEARAERTRGFQEARADRQLLAQRLDRLEHKVDTHFRWTIGLMMPIVVGILAIIVRVFFDLP